jgi:predicted N-formylglutamate amidohydrolase
MTNAFLVTCEHGGNSIPAAYRRLFREQKELLNSHYGYDPGSLRMARSLAAALDAPLVAATTSRLLIDLNRPTRHPQLYSKITRDAPVEVRAEIASRYYQPYVAEVECLVRKSVDRGWRVVHVSSHSFTPELNGSWRQADVGLLYDPGRAGEAALCGRWKAKLTECSPQLRIRRNYPYRGNAPGLTTQLRSRFSADVYVGVELEVNQGIVFGEAARWSELCRLVPQSLLTACAA